MTLIEAIQSFHSEVTAKPLSANARSLWLAIICLWNDRRRPSTITVGTPELRRLAGIKAKTTYHDALNALMSRKLVKICRRRGDLIELEPMPLRNSNQLKDKAILALPKTETEGAREAEPVVAKLENRTTGKYAGMTFAQMRAARLKEKSLNSGDEANGSGFEYT